MSSPEGRVGANSKSLRHSGFVAPAVFNVNGIGDNVLALPAIRALAELFGARLTVVSGTRTGGVFEDLPVKQVLGIRLDTSDGMPRFEPAELADRIGRCDLFVSLATWRSPDFGRLLQHLSPKQSIGYFAPFFTVAIPLDYGRHAADTAFGAVRVLAPSARLRTFLYPLSFSRPIQERADAAARLKGLRQPFLAVHADSATAKMWPMKLVFRVIDLFLASHAAFQVLVVGDPDAEVRSCIESIDRDRLIKAIDVELDVAFYLVSRASVFLGIDSCHLHVADLCGIPSVGLFGPTSAACYGFISAPHIALQGQKSCSAIAPQAVLGAVSEVTRLRDAVASRTISC